ncbi:MAG: FecR domain-containing protein [Balneolaceae bacterium]|nr:FecR domain-containing protein [Balneolaceae bacterium]
MGNRQLEELLADRSFVLWLKGQGTPEDRDHWEQWLRERPERHMSLVRQARELMGAIDSDYEMPDAAAELEKLNQKLDRETVSTQSLASRLQQRSHPYRRAMGAIAAGVLMLIVVLTSVFAYQQGYVTNSEAEQKQQAKKPEIQQYQTDYGEKLTFRLSDGSNIVLNANSEMRFSSHVEMGLNTEVWLEGEAYFDITHLEGDRQRTFTVHTDNGAIEVLGTRFSVNTFRDRTQAVLEKGKINIKVKEESVGISKPYLLEPGEMAQFTAYDNKIAVREVNTRIYTSWKEDKLIFDETPMSEVAQRIEDTFGVEVKVAERFRNEVLSGSIKSSSLEVLIEALEEILETVINIEGQKKRLLIGSE